jgi:site-specific recombinase XerD
LVNADAAVTSIQKLLGHRWLETTQIYILANDKQVCEDYYAACQKLEGWQFLWGV